MRPLDIVVLLKIVAMDNRPWQYRDLSATLYISISEISESLNRSAIAGLMDGAKRKVKRLALMEFIQYGLHYVFPQIPGAIVNGLATAHSHPYYHQHFLGESPYVWPSPDGLVRGAAIEPLHIGVVKASTADATLYRLLASIDILRVGKVREMQMALEELKKAIL